MLVLKIINRKWSILIITLIIIILLCSYFYFVHDKIKEDFIDRETLEEKIIMLGELTTLQYNYNNLLNFRDSLEIRGYEIPFTKKSFLLMYEGYIKAGVDLQTIQVELHGENSISLILNNAEFTDNVIKEDSVKVFDEKSGLFNPIMIDDVFNILEEEKKKTEIELRQKGFLDEANDKTLRILTPLLKEMGFEEINIYFNDNN
jgi:hypothetical protein